MRLTLPVVVGAHIAQIAVPAQGPTPPVAGGLNDVLIRVLNNNCSELGGAANTQGPLNRLWAVPPTSSGSGAGGTPTVDSQLGQTQEQRRQADRLAERRGGQGGSADQPGAGFGLFVNGDCQFLNKDTTRFETGFEQHTAGTTVGLDYSFRGAVLGVALNYAHEFGDFAGVGGGFNNDAYGVTLYGTVVPIKNLFIDGFLGYVRKEYSVDRRINFEIPDGAPEARGWRWGVSMVIRTMRVAPRGTAAHTRSSLPPLRASEGTTPPLVETS